MKKWGLVFLGIFVVLLLGCCQSNTDAVLPATEEPTTVSTFTVIPTITPTLAPSLTKTKIPFVRLFDPAPTKEATEPQTPVEISRIGTALPESDQAITVENINSLVQVGQWGYGSINGAAFTPDGKQFVISSAFGFAIYDMSDLQKPPQWVSFEQPISHDWIHFDESGKHMQLVNWKWHVDTIYTVVTFPEGKPVNAGNDLVWIKNVAEPDNSYMEDISSADGTKIFRAGYSIGESQFDRHTSKGYILDFATDKTLFTLQDETVIISYAERHPIDGCDAGLWQACGTSNVPVSYFPYQAAFSPDNATITIRYQKWLFYDYEMINDGFIRIYDGTDGSLLDAFGNPNDQTGAFAYSPDSKYLLVTYKNGSIQLWNTHAQEVTFSAWHFNDVVESMDVAGNGEYVLIQRPGYLEVRTTGNGALRSRLEAEQFELSPADSNIFAFTDSEYNIKVYDINKADVIITIPAHDDEIFDIAFAPDGKTIASSSRDCTIKRWDAETGEFLHYFEETIIDANDPYPHADLGNDRLSRIFIYRLEFVEDTNSLFGFSPWNIAVNWNTDSGATKYAIYLTPEYWSNFDVDLDTKIISFANNQYDFETGEELSRGNHSSVEESICYFNHEQNYFKIQQYYSDQNLSYYDIENNPVGIVTIFSPNTTCVTLKSVYISPDEETLYVTIDDGSIFVYQIVE